MTYTSNGEKQGTGSAGAVPRKKKEKKSPEQPASRFVPTRPLLLRQFLPSPSPRQPPRPLKCCRQPPRPARRRRRRPRPAPPPPRARASRTPPCSWRWATCGCASCWRARARAAASATPSRGDPLLWRRLAVEPPLSHRITDEALLALADHLLGCPRVSDAGLLRVVQRNPGITEVLRWPHPLPPCMKLAEVVYGATDWIVHGTTRMRCG